MNDLIRGTLWHWDRVQEGQPVVLQIYDGEVLTADTLLYDSAGATGDVSSATVRVPRLIPVDFAGRRWTLRFTQAGGLGALADYGHVWFVLFGGAISTLFLSGLILWRQDRFRFYRERAETGEALRQSEDRYRVLVEHSADGILIAALETRMFTYANPAMCRMLGYTEDELKTMGTSNIVPQDDLPRAVSEFEAQARGEKTLASDIPLRRKNGTIVHVDVNSATISIDGRLSMLGIFRDITERKQMEAQLRRQQNLVSTGTLARGMAHELNNPIMGIMNYAELISGAAAGNAALVDYAAEILAEGRRVAKMTHSLLDFTEQTAGAAVETATLEGLVAAMLPPVVAAAQKKGIVVSCDIPADLPPVTCRRGRFEQVVLALLSNALEAWGERDHVPEGSKRIRISARMLATGHQSSVISDRLPIGGAENGRSDAQLKLETRNSRIRLTVEDTGPGMPLAIRERVFDPFFTTKDRTKHAGLGLWTSRSFAQECGGELTFESEVGRGTRFRLELPTGDDRNMCKPLGKENHETNTDR